MSPTTPSATGPSGPRAARAERGASHATAIHGHRLQGRPARHPQDHPGGHPHPPCLRDSAETTRAIAEVLDIDVKSAAQVPQGYAVGSDRGQVEVFAASGAVRARNVERLTAYANESRKWVDVEREDDGTYRLGDSAAKELNHHGLELLSRIGIRDEYASFDVSLGQWAQLTEDGKEVDSEPGLLAQSWSGHGVREGEGRITITAATFGLLALPADVVQTYAAPALMVEGEISGVEVGRDETVSVRFGQYLPLAHPKALAGAGYGGGHLEPGAVVRGRVRGK